MGLFTFNFNTYQTGSNHGQQEPERPPTEKNSIIGFLVEVTIGTALTFVSDPYMTGARATVTQVLEILTVSPEQAPTYAALLCFAVVCAAPTIIRKTLVKVLN